jgi:hypothetical protein
MQQCDLGGGLVSSQLFRRALSNGREERVHRLGLRRAQVTVEEPVKGLHLLGGLHSEPYYLYRLKSMTLNNALCRLVRIASSASRALVLPLDISLTLLDSLYSICLQCSVWCSSSCLLPQIDRAVTYTIIFFLFFMPKFYLNI